MDRWEYMVRVLAFGATKEALEHYLNRDDIGKDGWELVSLAAWADNINVGNVTMIFKRRLQQKGGQE